MTCITLLSCPMNQKGVIHLALPVVVLIVAAVVALVYFGLIKNPLQTLPFSKSGPSVPLKSEYKNPFDKETQYVNPFETYKNPFAVSK